MQYRKTAGDPMIIGGIGKLAALFAAIIIFFVSAFATPAAAGKRDNSVRFAEEQAVDNLDPYFNNVRIGVILAHHIWDTLIYRDPNTGEYKGELATSWKWINDTTLELELRKGVKFHNGAEFDADDVVHTFNFVSKPESKAITTQLVDWIDHVQKLDRYKVRILTKHSFPASLEYLAATLVIHPHDYYAKVGPKGMSEKPIGTGPYRVVEHALGKYIRLERNPDYFAGSPKPRPSIERVEVRSVPDAQTQVAETVAGGLDLIMNVSRDQAEELRAVPRLQILSTDTEAIAYLQMNTLPNAPAPQLRDIRVRQAIMHAIDRDTMVKYLAGEAAYVLQTECHHGQFGCTDVGVPRYPYDPGRARQLLAEAGLSNGFDIDLYAYTRRNEAEAIAGYLRAVGIRARLRFMQPA